MKTNIIKTLSVIALTACFGKMNAQSDLLAINTASTVPSEIVAKYNTEEKIKISDFIPNPASNSATVSVRCANTLAMRVKFFTLNGDLAKEMSLNLTSGVNDLNVDMNGLSKGIYMVQFYSKEGSAVRKLLKQD